VHTCTHIAPLFILHPSRTPTHSPNTTSTLASDKGRPLHNPTSTARSNALSCIASPSSPAPNTRDTSRGVFSPLVFFCANFIFFVHLSKFRCVWLAHTPPPDERRHAHTAQPHQKYVATSIAIAFLPRHCTQFLSSGRHVVHSTLWHVCKILTYLLHVWLMMTGLNSSWHPCCWPFSVRALRSLAHLLTCSLAHLLTRPCSVSLLVW
jgi:hypothetical protein